MDTLRKIVTLEPGEELPGWLLVQDPHSPNSRPGMFVATTKLTVFENERGYWLLPDGAVSGPIVSFDGGAHMTIGAGNQRVTIMSGATVFFVEPGEGVDMSAEEYRRRGRR